MKSIDYEICGELWHISVLPKKEFQKKHGKKAYGITETEEQYIDFREDEFTMPIIRHEIMHAHFSYCFLESANLTGAQMEEVACDLYGYRGKIMDEQASDIYDILKEEIKDEQDPSN